MSVSTGFGAKSEKAREGCAASPLSIASSLSSLTMSASVESWARRSASAAASAIGGAGSRSQRRSERKSASTSSWLTALFADGSGNHAAIGSRACSTR